jgi:hypothetical protein
MVVGTTSSGVSKLFDTFTGWPGPAATSVASAASWCVVVAFRKAPWMVPVTGTAAWSMLARCRKKVEEALTEDAAQ